MSREMRSLPDPKFLRRGSTRPLTTLPVWIAAADPGFAKGSDHGERERRGI